MHDEYYVIATYQSLIHVTGRLDSVRKKLR